MYIFNVRESFHLARDYICWPLAQPANNSIGGSPRTQCLELEKEEGVSLKGTIMLDTQFHKCPCLSGFKLPGIHSSDGCAFQTDSLCLVLSWVRPHTQSCLNSCRQLRKHSQVYPSWTTPSRCEHWEGILWHSYLQEIHELNASHVA